MFDNLNRNRRCQDNKKYMVYKMGLSKVAEAIVMFISLETINKDLIEIKE